MADHGDDVAIGRELLGCRDGLRGVALVIERRQLKPISRQDRPLGVRVHDRELRPVEHALSLRGLIAGERRDEPDLDDSLGRTAADDECRCSNSKNASDSSSSP